MYRIKLTIFIVVVVLLACIYLPLLILLFPWRKKAGPLLLQFASKVCLKIFGVRIRHTAKNDTANLKTTGVVIISNHVNLLDIFVLSSLYRTLFVSKIEVKHYPMFGQIAWLMDIVFLKRDSEKDRHNVIRTIAEKAAGRIITVFPQGTTSSLSEPLPFKCGIFKTIELNHQVVFLPVTVHYEKDKEIAWAQDQLLMENAKRICSQSRIQVDVAQHSQLSSADCRGKTISEICAMVQKMVLNRHT